MPAGGGAVVRDLDAGEAQVRDDDHGIQGEGPAARARLPARQGHQDLHGHDRQRRRRPHEFRCS